MSVTDKTPLKEYPVYTRARAVRGLLPGLAPMPMRNSQVYSRIHFGAGAATWQIPRVDLQ